MNEQRHLTWVAAVATFLTALSLMPLMSEQPWVWPALFMVIAVGLVGFGARAAGMPAAVVLLGQIVISGLILAYQYGAADTRAWGLPTWNTLRSLDDLGAQGRLDISRFAPPILPERGVVLLVVAGITAVAIAVDLLVVGLRRAPLAGLPLLALYTIPIAVSPNGVPWYLFVLAGGSYVGLLVADGRERLLRWGRSMGFTEHDTEVRQYVDEVQTAPTARVGRRVGALAVGIAVAVPLLLPGFDSSLFGNGTGVGGTGGRTVVTNDPIVDLNRDLREPADVEVFSYTTKDPTPDYFRAVTLDTYDGKEWKQSVHPIPDDQVATEQLPTAPGVTSDLDSTAVRTQVKVSNSLESHWLPVPYPTTSLVATGRWVYDSSTLNIFGANRDTAGLSYTVNSEQIDYDPALAKDDVPPIVSKYLELPTLPTLVTSLAKQVTATATTPYDKAVALQEWFRSSREFTYTTKADPGHSDDALVRFLDVREGYCEQFAATMAIMARVLGIPSRVDVGFTPGRLTGTDTWTVTTHDAHAWPELYFDGLGWVRFEPTPSTRTGDAPGWTLPGAAPTTTAPTQSATAGPTGTSTGGATPKRGLEGLGDVPGSAITGGFHFPFIPVGVALFVLLLLFTPRLLRAGMTRARWRRARTDPELVLAGWAQLQDEAGDLGFEWDPSDTPRVIAETFRTDAGLMGDPVDALNRLARATERVLYARTAGVMPDVRADVAEITNAMSNSVERRDRMRARFLPASTRRVGHAMSEGVADGLDWVESIGARLRARGRHATS